ncbi:MAG: hypothetical protein QOJ13_3182 [Gaiellales bacterium]|nr:hypothetical protein [Gaiellales bacterium]
MEAGKQQHPPGAPGQPLSDEELDHRLDEALEETFPASDPVAAEIPER